MSRLDGWLVLFDWNGTLLDDAERALGATNRVLAARGRATLDTAGFSLEFRLPLTAFFEQLDIDDPVDAEAEWNQAMSCVAPVARVASRPVLGDLRRLGATTGVVSAAAEDLVRSDLDRLGLDGLVQVVVGDARDKARTLSDLRAGRSGVYVGDTDYDVRCAKVAGFLSVGLTCGYQAPSVVMAAGPALVLDRLEDLLGALHSPTSDLTMNERTTRT